MRRADAGAPLSEQQATQADAGVKGMISVGRPFLDYVISALADAGVREVVLVVGPEHSGIREYFEQTAPPARVRVRFAEQAEALGTADAVVAAAAVVGDASFLVLNADNYYPVAAYEALLALDGAGVVAFDRETLVTESNIDEERVRSFAILQISVEGRLLTIVEKPGETLDLRAPSARWVGMNLWTVTPALVDACRRVPLSTRGEFELPEAVALALKEGQHVHAVQMHAGVLDLSRRSDIAVVAARLSTIEANP
ncbi:MAG: NTP transferase domain-containing protein [Phycisphaerae bacterium]|nr:NTP transferase domain-containing protein [Gemmatimonadaceae bacterium]